MEQYKVYLADSEICYTGIAIIAAESAEEANSYIESFKYCDKNNSANSFGLCYVKEDDQIPELSSSKKGIIYNTIMYIG